MRLLQEFRLLNYELHKIYNEDTKNATSDDINVIYALCDLFNKVQSGKGHSIISPEKIHKMINDVFRVYSEVAQINISQNALNTLYELFNPALKSGIISRNDIIDVIKETHYNSDRSHLHKNLYNEFIGKNVDNIGSIIDISKINNFNINQPKDSFYKYITNTFICDHAFTVNDLINDSIKAVKINSSDPAEAKKRIKYLTQKIYPCWLLRSENKRLKQSHRDNSDSFTEIVDYRVNGIKLANI